MNRSSKIARLPNAIREELNQRLRAGEPGNLILQWINALPEVIKLADEHFHGNLISPQNLSDWNQGGYLIWLDRAEIHEEALDFETAAADLTPRKHPSLTGPLTTAINARYAVLLTRITLNEETPKYLQDKLKGLNSIHQEVARQRRNELQAQRLALLAAEAERQREKSDAEMTELFLKWTERPEVRAALLAKYETDQKRQARITEAMPYLRNDQPLPEDAEDAEDEEEDDESETEETDETASTKSTADEDLDETFTPEFFPETYAAMRAQKQAARKARRKPTADADADEPEPDEEEPRKPDTYTEVAPGIKLKNVPPAFAAYHVQRLADQKARQESAPSET